MSVKCQQIISIIEELAPKYLAESWDNVGLMIGSPSMNVQKLMVCLDVDQNVLDEAIEKGVDLIISHHPIIFSPIKNLRWDNYKGKLMKELITREIGVYSAHTNLDISSQGINYWLAKKFNLNKIEVLDKLNYEKLYKFVIFVPKSNIEEVKAELGKQEAGWIGNYSHCSFSTTGTGNFKPLENTNPFIGTPYNVEEVEEVRLETIIKESNLSKTIKAVLKVHPYEEVAYDIYPLENKGQVQGLGIIGILENEIEAKEFIELVKHKLHVVNLRGSGNLPEKIKKVAICSGAGASLMNKAKFAGADVFITGDLKYHDGQTANEIDLFIIDPGHYATEIIVRQYLSKYLYEKIQSQKLKVDVIKSEANRDYINLY
ncbi:Nif3-like dinuclear metal center hexameric protein [Alkalibaculum sp. M08DMB]|uniref:GTP cyclohydrolase 1 type 2 homolog n=1 Tax=Alkalibaculum sporogenes TaxID=2655001 RepID=A0A6A7KCX2_9FIRM|nr:Nif3-like dinuclear metal center hexameric protein [Alkalibaculum sporogenes]MPW27017.1 Nif3-like dinuclear metal center hexameric protein [Alkalibaculum sporogenes]